MADPFPLEQLRDIPDPAATVRASPASPPRLPDGPAPTRADRRRRIVVAAACAVGWVAATTVVLGVRPDIASPSAFVPAAVWLIAGAVALGVVLRPRARGLPVGVRVVQHAVWVVPATYALVALLVARPASLPLTWATARPCFVSGAAIGLGVLGAAALVLRGTFLAAAGWRGAAVGAVAGLAGAVAMHAHCPVPCLGHLLAAHGAPIALFALAGGLLGRVGGRP